MQKTFSGNTKTYVTPEDVAETVRVAIALGRPLLVEGEPGCGKTRLAGAIADDVRAHHRGAADPLGEEGEDFPPDDEDDDHDVEIVYER